MNVRSSLSRTNNKQHLRPESIDVKKCVSPRGSSSRTVRSAKRQHDRTTVERVAKKPQVVWLESQEQDRLLRRRSLEEAKQGNYLFAVEGLSLLIDRNPRNAADYNNRGLVQFQWGQQDAALEDYNRAIELNPKLASAYNNRANYYAAQDQLAEAIADYDIAIDLDPTNIRAWINQGITFRDLEMYSQAIENFEHALQISDLLARNSGDSRALEAHVYAARGRTHHLAGDWNYAVADYYRTLDRLGEASSTRLHRQVTIWMQELKG
jgi:tetratricopeptide (TPR) repeat protein